MPMPTLSSLFALGRTPAPTASPAAAPPAQPTGVPGSSMQPSNAGAANPQAPAEGAPASPLDAYKDLWKTAGTEGQQPADPFAAPLFQTDPNKLREAVTKTDFLQGVPQELMQKVMAGNDPQSLMQLINHVGQQSLALSVQLTSSLQEQAGQTIGERFKKAIPDKFKELQLNSQPPENPILANPAVEPMLKMAKQQIRMTNPDLSAAEINQRAEQYIMAFATSVAGGSGPSSTSGSEQKAETDWAAWGG